MKNLSLTMKITIWYTIFLVVITGSFLLVLSYTGNSKASGTARTKLLEAVSDARDEISRVGENYIIDSDLDFYEDGVYLSIYDDSGDMLEGRRPASLLSVFPALEDKKLHKLKADDGETWYVYDSLFDLDGTQIWIRGMVKDFAEGETISFMMKTAALAFPLLALIAAIGGYFIIRRSFSPVRELIRTADEISHDSDLSRRIDLDTSDETPRDEIYTLARAFNGMFDNLEESFEKEKRFTSDVSHELRTPLSVIISQSDYAMEDEEYREKALSIINKEARHMSGLVNMLLSLARSDAGTLKLNREKIDFSELCETVVQQQAPIAAASDITVKSEITPDITVFGDETMLIRIVLNLMDNAVKYGRQGGLITLSLKNADGYACCSVSDDGIGIKAEELDKIWERFYRSDVSRSREGTGLGLSIVEALVKAHGGSISAESEYGQGSRFTVRIPLYSAADDTEAENGEQK